MRKQHLVEYPEFEYEFNGSSYEIYVYDKKFGKIKNLPDLGSARAFIHIGRQHLLQEYIKDNNEDGSILVKNTILENKNKELEEQLFLLLKDLEEAKQKNTLLSDTIDARSFQLEQLNNLVDEKNNIINDYKNRLEKVIKDKNDIIGEFETVKHNTNIIEESNKKFKQQVYDLNKSLKQMNSEMSKLQNELAESKNIFKALKKAWKSL